MRFPQLLPLILGLADYLSDEFFSVFRLSSAGEEVWHWQVNLRTHAEMVESERHRRSERGSGALVEVYA